MTPLHLQREIVAPCPKCGARMKPLFSSNYCSRECDRPAARSSGLDKFLPPGRWEDIRLEAEFLYTGTRLIDQMWLSEPCSAVNGSIALKVRGRITGAIVRIGVPGYWDYRPSSPVPYTAGDILNINLAIS